MAHTTILQNKMRGLGEGFEEKFHNLMEFYGQKSQKMPWKGEARGLIVPLSEKKENQR